MTSDSTWCLYVLECADGSLYTGITNNLAKRVKTHNSGKGSKYTRARLPCVLSIYAQCPSKSFAAKSEIRFKKLPREKKLKYISTSLENFFEDFCADLFLKDSQQLQAIS